VEVEATRCREGGDNVELMNTGNEFHVSTRCREGGDNVELMNAGNEFHVSFVIIGHSSSSLGREGGRARKASNVHKLSILREGECAWEGLRLKIVWEGYRLA
jgi:hypothetical protein